VDFSALFNAVQSHATSALLVMALLALAWIYKDQRARDREYAEEIRELYKAHTEAMQSANAKHLETALQVAPLATKLVTCVEVLERLSFRAREG
jgi:hypothetical protein